MHKVELFKPGAPLYDVGSVEFYNLVLGEHLQYKCEPAGILTEDQIQELCRYLRRLPPVSHVTIGPYRWKEAERLTG
jgi:hypothetical protein